MIAGAKRRLYVLILAINPASGRGRAQRQAKLAGEYFRSRDIDVREIEGTSLQDFRKKLLICLDSEEVSGVIALGGDGFIHEIIQHLVSRDIPLGVIPCGTGNDFARSIGVFDLPFSRQLELIEKHDATHIDLGRVQDQWFAAILSSGFDALVNDRANSMRWPRGRMRYNIAMIEKLIALRPHSYRIRVDESYLEVQATLVTVANGSSYGGGMKVCPDASINDGLFDVMVLGRVSRIELLKVFPKVYRGGHVGHPAVTFYRCNEIEIDGSGSSFADGEPIAQLPLIAKCVSAALKVWAA
jgi:diacylglycerol kinase (ATP)